MSAAVLHQLLDIGGIAQIGDMRRGVDLVGGAQPVGQRLQRIAAAGGEKQVAAFLGKGFGGGRANAFGRAGDEDALAAQMQIHGIFSLVGIGLGQGGAASFDWRPAAVNTALQRCVAARFGPLQSRSKQCTA